MNDHDPEHYPSADAFVTAIQGETFAGQPLNAWSPPCKIAAQSMGMLYPFIGDEGLEIMSRTGIYPGELRDVIIFLWLRCQAPAAVIKAQSKPLEAWGFASAWAEGAGLLDIRSPAFEEGSRLFVQKMNAIAEATGTPSTQGTPGDPKAPCPPAGGPSMLV